MNQKKLFFSAFLILIGIGLIHAQDVKVDVNLDIKHSVNGVSDFGRERHITLHSSLSESDWIGEDEKMKYLLDDLDVYLGRDNGSATWKFQYSAEDPDRPNHADPDSLKTFANWYKGEYEEIITKNHTKQYESRSTEMIMGTNPHPTYPTFSYWHMCGSEWGRANGYDWIPLTVESSAEWMVDYMENFFVNTLAEKGELAPKYWEVINEPDMLLNTGAFMVSSWELLWKYHNLVAKGIKERLGDKAPLIGGMTWGLHDLASDDLTRARDVNYASAYYGNTPADEQMKALAAAAVESKYLTQTGPWTQWDVLWKGFMDEAGKNMDFYSIHIYDWPTYGADGGTIRSGGHTEAMLDLIEWYDVNQNGINKRKPLVVSEYGAVQGAWTYKPHEERYDWENLKPFNSMLMQFLERPDYIVKSMPFTPVKATWGDTDKDGNGKPDYFYHSKMLRDDDQDGNWEWSEFIKWYELWDDIKGTRVDTKSSDPDVQVDCYIDGKDVYLILNNLEDEATNINLNFFGSSLKPKSVRMKHMYLKGASDVTLDDKTQNSAPASVVLNPDATMVLKYSYDGNIAINQTSTESKFYGNSVGNNQHVPIVSGDNTFYVNGLDVPSNIEQTEAMLRITGNFYDAPDNVAGGFLTIKKLSVNGTVVKTPIDWRGTQQLRSRYFGTLEIPIPANLLQANNTITVDFQHAGEISVVNIVTWEFSKVPGRSVAGKNSAPLVNAGTDQSLAEGTTSATLSGSGSDVDGDAITYSWTKVSGAAATIANSSSASTSISGLSAGTYVFRLTASDGTLSSTDDVQISVAADSNTDVIVIEAEDLTSTSGTYNDGTVPLGVNVIANQGINYVNNGDYAVYNVTIPEDGAYEIVYYISSPIDGSTITFSTDNITTTVPNNGKWDVYTALKASKTVNFTAGNHEVTLTAGATAWAWNLDKFTLRRVGAIKSTKSTYVDIDANSPLVNESTSLSSLIVYPNPYSDGSLTIKFPKHLGSMLVKIYSITGKCVYLKEFHEESTVQINSSELKFSKGIYTIKASSSDKIFTQKLIIQ
ncbi:hypothetical protein BZG02_15635 [Labilibaculum filiforme]|uniref:CBM6 domain-containing protein n=1 Tax=Labilibaculum filiforme TaxID=1940526 RepID=A0A2N3HTK0_9BACT|nr:T9SS type A sorting domain-containing protein [Labilibaculum filiforme]PKQ61390.1 hypothetical protein BZG02_15635 [Labilibaculum filiforme]